VVDDVPVGRVFRDGNLLVSAEDGPVRSRRRLSFAGIIVVSLVLERDGELAADPEIAIEGLPEEASSGSMADLILDAIEGAIESIPRGKRKDQERLREAVSRAARSAANDAWGKKPVCKVLLTVV